MSDALVTRVDSDLLVDFIQISLMALGMANNTFKLLYVRDESRGFVTVHIMSAPKMF